MLNVAMAVFEEADPKGLFAVSEYGELLRYGVTGLVLGLVLAALTFLAFAKFEGGRITAIKVVLGYGVVFAVIAVGYVLASQMLVPEVYVSVKINPEPDPERPDGLPIPMISTSLDPGTPVKGRFLVKRDAQINVNIAAALRKYADEREKGNRLVEKVSDLNGRNASLNAIASRGAAFKAADSLSGVSVEVERAAASGSANPLADVAAKRCDESEGGPSCGIAKLARGDVAAAQVDFTNALTKTELTPSQRVAATNGLGYTYVLQGNNAKAIEQFKASERLGDAEAKTRLSELSAEASLTIKPEH